jgi:hypothetical protein
MCGPLHVPVPVPVCVCAGAGAAVCACVCVCVHRAHTRVWVYAYMDRFVDARARALQQTWRSSFAYAGPPRVLACHYDLGPYVAVGSASGVLTVLDARTGVMVSSARPHDADVCQVCVCMSV